MLEGYLSKNLLHESTSEDEKVTKTFIVTGNFRNVQLVEAMLAYMDKLGCDGHSTGFKVYVDGDGCGRINVTDENKKRIMKNVDFESLNLKTDRDGDIEHFGFE